MPNPLNNKKTTILVLSGFIAVIAVMGVTSMPLEKVSGQIETPNIDPVKLRPLNVVCPTEDNLQHWDKIIFEVAIPGSDLMEGPFDIKVKQDPNAVTDLQQEVADFLNDPDNKIPDKLKRASEFKTDDVDIIDVEYSTVCVK